MRFVSQKRRRFAQLLGLYIAYAFGFALLCFFCTFKEPQERFDAVVIGMTESEVQNVLGKADKEAVVSQPKARFSGNPEDLKASVLVKEAHWDFGSLRCIVTFDTEGKVWSKYKWVPQQTSRESFVDRIRSWFGF